MHTTNAQFGLDLDQEIGITLHFDAEFAGDPIEGFTLRKATMVGYSVWIGDTDVIHDVRLDFTEWLISHFGVARIAEWHSSVIDLTEDTAVPACDIVELVSRCYRYESEAREKRYKHSSA